MKEIILKANKDGSFFNRKALNQLIEQGVVRKIGTDIFHKNINGNWSKCGTSRRKGTQDAVITAINYIDNVLDYKITVYDK